LIFINFTSYFETNKISNNKQTSNKKIGIMSSPNLNKTIVSIKPTFFLRKVKYENVVNNYNLGKYSILPAIIYKPKNNNYIAQPIKNLEKTVGFQTKIGSVLYIIKGEERKGICANCQLSTSGFCSIGIPYKIERVENSNFEDNKVQTIVTIYVNGEICSPECSLSYIKKIGRLGFGLNPKYAYSEQMIRNIYSMLYNDNKELKEAPSITELIPFGEMNVNAYRKNLHLYIEKIESHNSNSPILKILNKSN